MARRLLLMILTFLSVHARAQTSVIFSVQAHQDDWELFMGVKILADLNAGAKIVFITLTAGDASAGSGSYGPSGVPFYTARENGSIYAAKYLADIKTGATTPDILPTATTVAVNGHNITKYTYKGIVNYFFRLPDGNGNGSGFASTGNVSLERLKSGAIPSISALGSVAATYTSWTDLTNTIKQIMTNEKVTGTQAWIYSAHTIDGTNSSYNPGDHSDHRYSSLAAQNAVASGMAWVGVAGFMDYASSGNGANLGTTDHENSTAFFGLTVMGMVEAAYGTTFNSGHLGWLPMEYYQVIRTPSGNAPFAGFAGNEESPVEPAGSLTKIPMTSSITSPVFVNKDIMMMVNPYEPGVLSTLVFDEAGNKVFEQSTDIKNRDAVLITLKQPAATKGTYLIKNILNEKYVESRKITVE